MLSIMGLRNLNVLCLWYIREKEKEDVLIQLPSRNLLRFVKYLRDLQKEPVFFLKPGAG